jgi:hypothetical protein
VSHIRDSVSLRRTINEKKIVVITGASDGIGAAAARRLHADGHTVVIVGRSVGKTRAVAAELGADSYVADFTRLDDVARLAGQLRAACPRIDVLANNAGGMFGEKTTTADGFEKTFQVNHLAPFLLTRLLLDTLITSRASVLQTSSTARICRSCRQAAAMPGARPDRGRPRKHVQAGPRSPGTRHPCATWRHRTAHAPPWRPGPIGNLYDVRSYFVFAPHPFPDVP